MKLLRKKLREKITARLGLQSITLARIDRWNNQLTNLDQERAADYQKGVIYIEIDPIIWDQDSDRNLQEADVTIRLYICRTWLEDTADDTATADPLAILDIVNEVVKAVHGQPLEDDLNRSLSTPWVRTGQSEDNDHDQLEVDQVEFTARVFDYLTDPPGRIDHSATLVIDPEEES